MKTLIAMSGGVDSAAAARLILEEGDTAEGCTLCLCPTPDRKGGGDGDLARAREVAASLGIPHRTLELTADFHREIILPFCLEYTKGRTPNPCVECNRCFKLGRLYDYALAEGFDRLATGHYARILRTGGRYRLAKAKDPAKDQSYMLYRLREEQLSRLAFPLGELSKSEVRAIAQDAGLAVAAAKESQDICFVQSGHYAALVKEVLGSVPPEGNYVDAEGRVLGRHRGIIHYTLGQHKGLGIALGRVRYVTRIDPQKNEVTLGDEEELYTKEVRLSHLHYIGERRSSPYRAAARLRYRQQDEPVSVYPDGEGALLLFDRPQRAPTPGQSAVLYEGDLVLGGGVI